MSRIISEEELPLDLQLNEAVRTAYPSEFSRVEQALSRNFSVLIETDKIMVGRVFSSLRTFLRDKFSLTLVDGRSTEEGGIPQGIIGTMIGQITNAVRNGIEDESGKKSVIVLLHFDLLVTSQGTLTSEAKEVVGLMNENPDILWIGFKDPTLSVPESISKIFTQKIPFIGTSRDRLRYLVTKKESQKLSREKGLDIYKLYKQVSGTNCVRLRQILSSLHDMEDYPVDPSPAWAVIRESTIEGNVEIPNLRFSDIGGYEKVKRKLREEILDLLSDADESQDESEIQEIETLIPRGMLFEGPPGTGKTLFAKAIANELGAAVKIVSGPELKSKWVGESEENLRRVFAEARKMAPCIIVFDEIDSFAFRRDQATSSGVEHSMVNQLLTEMDGFSKNEMVFIVGTTNFVESIDPALLRPGRFEFHITIPNPEEEDREAIFKIYNKKFRLEMTEKAIADAVKITGFPLANGRGWSGDHIQALCRQMARMKRREKRLTTEPKDVERARTASNEDAEMNDAEKLIVATHECGHAIVQMEMKDSPPISRISIQGNISGALGFVESAEHENKIIMTHNQLYERILILFGGLLAERVHLNSVSIGSSHDLLMANRVARALVVNYGYENVATIVGQSHKEISEATKKEIDVAIKKLILKAEKEALQIIEGKKEELVALRTQLLKDEVIDLAPRKVTKSKK